MAGLEESELETMAGPTEDYQTVLGSNDITHQEEETTEKNKTLEKLVGVGGEESQGVSGSVAETDMASAVGNSIHRSGSRPQLDLSKAEIQGNFEERDPTILLPNQSDDISHLALDIGGIALLVFPSLFLLKVTAWPSSSFSFWEEKEIFLLLSANNQLHDFYFFKWLCCTRMLKIRGSLSFYF